MNWHEYYLNILDAVKTKSKDPSTQVGAIIVGKDNEIRSLGFNGFPRGVEDDPEKFPDRYERPLKYALIEHAERNAVYNSARVGIPLDGCTIYVHWLPCNECAKAIIQCGIKRVIIDGRDYVNSKEYWSKRWGDSMQHSLLMLSEAGIDVEYYKDGNILKYGDDNEQLRT